MNSLETNYKMFLLHWSVFANCQCLEISFLTNQLFVLLPLRYPKALPTNNNRLVIHHPEYCMFFLCMLLNIAQVLRCNFIETLHDVQTAFFVLWSLEVDSPPFKAVCFNLIYFYGFPMTAIIPAQRYNFQRCWKPGLALQQHPLPPVILNTEQDLKSNLPCATRFTLKLCRNRVRVRPRVDPKATEFLHTALTRDIVVLLYEAVYQ